MILATANLYPQSGRAVITNNSDSVTSFNSDFGISFANYGSGTYTVSYAVSQVPLPAAALLFASGLTGIAGFAKRKKA